MQEERRNNQTTAHVGRVLGVCVEKDFHLSEGSPGRKFKGRVAYQGNKVKDQEGNWAIFQELQSCPSTMAGPQIPDFYSLLEGRSGESADAEMAYT